MPRLVRRQAQAHLRAPIASTDPANQQDHAWYTIEMDGIDQQSTQLQEDHHLDLSTPVGSVRAASERGDAISVLTNHQSSSSEDVTIQDNAAPEYENLQVSSAGVESTSCSYLQILRKIWLPISLLMIPTLVMWITLLAILFSHPVLENNGIFSSTESRNSNFHTPFILVDFPATLLVYIASGFQTLSGLLGGSVMALFRYPIARKWQRDSRNSYRSSQNLTCFELAILINLLLGYPLSLRPYINYRWSEYRERLGSYFESGQAQRCKVPLIVRESGMLMMTVVLLQVLVALITSLFHWKTTSVDHITTTALEQASYLNGRRISDFCLTFDRPANAYYPCSYDWSPAANAEAVDGDTNTFLYERGESPLGQINLVTFPESRGQEMAMVMPRNRDVPSNLDFTARSIGVATTCEAISRNCSMRSVGNKIDEYTRFQCSPDFFGVLGLPPNDTDPANHDPTTPLYAIKEARDYEIGFFQHRNLTKPYYTYGRDPYTGDPDWSIKGTPDSQLINPFFAGFAFRFGWPALGSGGNSSNDPGLWQGWNPYTDAVFACEINTYNVLYSWINGDITITHYEKTNGSVPEIFHGRQLFGSTSGLADTYSQDMITRISQLRNSTEMTSKWAALYSAGVASRIATYMVPSSDEREQRQTSKVVTRIEKWALCLMLLSGLPYPVLAIYFTTIALRASGSRDMRDLINRVDIPGLIDAAFGDAASLTGDEPFNWDKLKRIPGRIALHETSGPRFEFMHVLPKK